MADADFPLNINRRRLLVSVAAVPVASILAGTHCAESPRLADAAEPPSTVLAANFSAATVRRLREIAQRNAIRREAGLPLLSIAHELRRMKEQDERARFEQFEAVHGKAVWNEILRRRREAEGNPNWKPRWIDVVGYQNEVRKILRQKFRASSVGIRLC